MIAAKILRSNCLVLRQSVLDEIQDPLGEECQKDERKPYHIVGQSKNYSISTVLKKWKVPIGLRERVVDPTTFKSILLYFLSILKWTSWLIYDSN